MQKGNPLSADILTNLFRTSPKDPLRIIIVKARPLNLRNHIAMLAWHNILKQLQRLPIIQVAISFLVLETNHGVYWA